MSESKEEAMKSEENNDCGSEVNKLFTELVTLLDSTCTGCDTNQDMSLLVTKIQKFDDQNKLNHQSHNRAFALIFDRLLLAIKPDKDETTATSSASSTTHSTSLIIADELYRGLQMLGADFLPLDLCSSYISTLLDTVLVEQSPQYRHPWFLKTIAQLSQRLEESKHYTDVSFVRTSFKRLLTWLCSSNYDNASDMFEHLFVPPSCHDELDMVMDSLLELVAPLLPNYLVSGCVANPPTVSPGDITCIRRVSCLLLDLLLKRQEAATPARRQHVFSTLLNAAIHFETLSTSSSSSSSTAAAAAAACEDLLKSFGQYRLAMESRGATLDDALGVVIERLLATCCFRSLLNKSSFLGIILSSLIFDRKITKTDSAFVTKLAEYSRLAHMQRWNGWLAAASAQCTCNCRHSATFEQDVQVPLAQVLRSLTSARLRRTLDTIRPDVKFMHETVVQRLAVRLIETDNAGLGALASQLFDYLHIYHRASLANHLIVSDLVSEFFFRNSPQDTRENQTSPQPQSAPTMATRRALGKVIRRVFHSGAASYPPSVSSSASPDSDAPKFASLAAACTAYARYSRLPIVFGKLLAGIRLNLVKQVVLEGCIELLSLSDQELLNGDTTHCLDQLELIDESLNAVSPLLFYFMCDNSVQEEQRTHTNHVTFMLATIETKLATLAASSPSTLSRQLKLAGILVTLLRALSGCIRPQCAMDDNGRVMPAAAQELLKSSDKERLELNMPMCTRVIEMLKAMCDQERHSAAVKTLIYSAMPAICRANPLIEESIVQMLMSRIDAYISSSLEGEVQLVTRLDVNGNNEIVVVLVEPVDVLLQSLEICTRPHRSSTNPSTANKSNDPRSRACRAVNSSARFYLQSGGTGETVTRLVEQHLQQLDAKCQRHRSALDGVSTLNAENMLRVRFQCLKIAFQLELGLVEVLIEHTLMSETPTADTYANVSLLLKRHQAIGSLFPVRLEEMKREQERLAVLSMTKKQLEQKISEEMSSKRKIATPPPSAGNGKRARLNGDDKENPSFQQASLSAELAGQKSPPPLSNISNNDKEAAPTDRQSPKRKFADEPTTTCAASPAGNSKRARLEGDDKENPSFQQASTSAELAGQKTRPPLGNISVNIQISTTTTIQPSMPSESVPKTAAASPRSSSLQSPLSPSVVRFIKSYSTIDMKLGHVQRLSMSCLVHMCQLHMSSTTNSAPIGDVLELVTLITDETFVEFTLGMIEKKLESLDCADARLDYDPESLNSVDLADRLTKLWHCFIQRVCGSNTQAPQFTYYRPAFSSSSTHSDVFFERTYRYARLSQLIWRYLASTGDMDADRNCDRLVQDERAQYACDDKLLFSFNRAFSGLELSPLHLRTLKVEKDKAIVYWKLVANLMRTVKLHLPPTKKTPPANQALNEAATVKRDNERLCAAKICGELLELVALVLASHRQPLDILSLVEPRRKHELIQWLYELASHELVSTPTAAAIRLGCTIYELISRLTAQSTTNAHLMKALALDMYKCRISNELTIHNSIIADQSDQRQPHETFLQFQFFKSSLPNEINIGSFDMHLIDDLDDFFDMCKWSIEHRRTFFANDGAKLVQLIAAQLATCIVPTLVYRLKSVERVDDEKIDYELVLCSLERFFKLVSFILSELTQESDGNKLPDRVVLALRQLIGSINQQLLDDCLPRQLNRLSEQLFLVNAEQDHENIRTFKVDVCSLLDVVGEFEAELRTANVYFKSNNDIFIIDQPSIERKIYTQKLAKIANRFSQMDCDQS